jgi:hypothetical protein
MIVAHYRKSVALTIATLMIALAVCGIYIIFYPPSWHPAAADAPIVRLVRIALMFLAAPLLIVRYAAYLRQILFKNDAAIWIADGVISFIDSSWRPWITNVPLREVESVQLGKANNSGANVIVLTTKSGNKWVIRAWELLEPPEQIITSLNAAI